MSTRIETLCRCAGEVCECEYLDASRVDEFRSLGDWLDDPPVYSSRMPDGVETLISVAWYLTEEAIRFNTGQCSSNHTRKDFHAPETENFTCQCCRYFASMRSRAERLRRYL